MKRFIFMFCVFLMGEGQEEEREPKFFFGPRVETVYAYRKVPKLVTEFVPSSCIVVEPSLPACRHVRNLEIHPSVPTRISRTQVPGPADAQDWRPQPSEPDHHAPTPPLRLQPQVKYTQPYWGWNLFNIFRVQNYTHTSTKTEYVTTRVQDTNSVVSFYVKGCRPTRLPFDLPECARAEEPKNFVVMAPLKFIPSADNPITPSKIKTAAKEEDDETNENAQTAPEGTSSYLYLTSV